MLKPIEKNLGVNESERALSKLINNTFLSLWSYPSPFSDEGFTKNKSGKEICDALVVFGRKIIIFSDKNIKFNIEKGLDIAWPRWRKKSIIDSARQLHAAEAWLKNHPSRVFLDKFCTVKFPIDLESGRFEFHLIAITKNSSTPARKYFNQDDRKNSGTFVSAYKLPEQEIIQHPFTLNDIDECKTFVHVWDEYSAELVISELGTISDFVRYLSAKEKAIRTGHLRGAAGEEEILGTYFLGKSQDFGYGSIDLPKIEGSNLLIGEGQWDFLVNSHYYQTIEQQRKAGEFWTDLTTRLSDGVITAEVGEGQYSSFQSHEIAIRSLATENRASRAKLSLSFIEKFHNVPSGVRSSRLVSSPTDKEKLYIFLLLPRNSSESYEDYRKNRQAAASLYSLVAKHQNSQYTKIQVIATEPQNSEGRSESIYLSIYPHILPHAEQKRAKEISRKYSILRERTIYDGDPTRDHLPKLKQKIGRNDPCHCGSKKKYKNCCL